MQTTAASDVAVWQRRALWLAWFTIAFNLLEGAVSLHFGWSDESISLMGFGADSLIEVASATLVLWRLAAGHDGGAISKSRERVATRWIGVLFVLLALGTSAGAVLRLLQRAHPDTALPGLVVALISLSFMFFLWRAKQRAARVLDSATLEKDAACSRACIQLSAILLAGSGLFVVAPSLWWADAVAALALSGLIGREGIDTMRAAAKEDFDGGCGCS